MKYCSNCGKQVNDEDKICMHCGSKVGKSQSTQPDSAGILSLLVSFLIPLFGLLVYGANHVVYPKKSRSCLIAAGLGFLINLILFYIILQNELFLMS